MMQVCGFDLRPCRTDTSVPSVMVRLCVCVCVLWEWDCQGDFIIWCDQMGFLGGTIGKEPTGQCRRLKRHGFDPWVRKIPWRGKWQPTPVFLPGKYYGQRSLVG